jgi:tetratricopeptide (TPR) repeat protein
MAQNISVVHEALRCWHVSDKLATTRLAHAQHKGTGSDSDSLSVAVRQLLTDAFWKLRSAPSYHSPSDKPQHSLAFDHYVLSKSVVQICSERNVARSTFYRALEAELAEIQVIIERSSDALAPDAILDSALDMRTRLRSALPKSPACTSHQKDVQVAKACLFDHSGSHTLAVTGMPGIGKSSFAAQLANDDAVQNHFRDGVLWANVGPARDTMRCLMQWWMIVFGEGRTPPLVASKVRADLCKALGGRQVLFVLDDVWHDEDVETLMIGDSDTASYYVLTTGSPALAHKFANDVITLTHLEITERVCLLRHMVPELATHASALVTNPNDVWDEVAVALGGTPLALSVSARTLRWLAKTGQQRRMRDYIYRDAAGDVAAALARRVGKTVQLLSEVECLAFASLCTLPSKPDTTGEACALAVGTCEVTTLDKLVDLGLVEASCNRYALHPDIGHVGRNLLTLEQAAEARGRLVQHVAYMLSDSSSTAFDTEDIPVIQASLNAAGEMGLDKVLMIIAVGAFPLFEARGRLDALLPVLSAAVVRAHKAHDHAWACLHLGQAQWLLNDTGTALATLQAALTGARMSGDKTLIDRCAHLLAAVEFEEHRPADSVAHAQEASAAKFTEHGEGESFNSAGHEAWTLRCFMQRLHVLDRLRNALVRIIPAALEHRVPSPQIHLAVTAKGWLDFLDGDVGHGLTQLTQAHERASSQGYRPSALFAEGCLAWAHHCLSRFELARQFSTLVLDAGDKDLLPDFTTLAHQALGATTLAQGNPEDARRQLEAGILYAQQRRSNMVASGLHLTLADVHLVLGDLDAAQHSAQVAYNVAKACRFDVNIAASLVMMATVNARLGEVKVAHKQFEEAFAVGRVNEGRANPWTEAYCRRHYGECLLRVNDYVQAIIQLGGSARIYDSLQSPEGIGRSLFGLAKAHLAQQDEQAARDTFARGQACLRGIGHALADEMARWGHMHL